MTAFRHFDPNDPNVDLDCLERPTGLWQRVAVVGLWSSKERIRKAWPSASAVGPLRTTRGLDLLLRGLLANPAIRVVVIDGPDLRPDVTKSLRDIWSSVTDEWGLSSNAMAVLVPVFAETEGNPEARQAFYRVLDNVRLMTLEEWDTSGMGADGNLAAATANIPDEDRPGGAHFLPAPKPTNLDVLPHGDPGQRVVGDTLAEVWPRALEQAMRFGRKVPTQYGETREILALTSVIRDPKATLDEFTSTLKYTTDGLGIPHATLHGPNNVAHGPRWFCFQCEPESALASLKKDLEDRTLLLVLGFMKAWNEEPAREPNFQEESGRSADYAKIREDKIDGFPRAEVHAYPGGLELRPDGYDEEFTRAYGYLDGDTQFGAEVRRILSEAGIRRFDGTFFWDRTVRGGVVLLADAALLDEITRRRLGLFAAAMEQKYGAPLATLEQWLIDPPKPVALTETVYDPHPILGFTYGDVLTYYRQIVGLDSPGERAYSYGSRMRGTVPESPVERLKRELQEAVVSETLYMRGMQTAASKPAVDQIAAIGKLLTDSPGTRAAYLTPWKPDEDSGKESGRPCLCGIWFRTTGAPTLRSDRSPENVWDVGMRRLRDGLRATEWYQSEQEKEQAVPPRADPYAWLAFERDAPLEPGQDGTRSSAGGKRVLPPLSELDLSDTRTLSALRACGHLQSDRLHMVAAFRSHDAFAGYPSNLAALCMWLVEESERLNMEPGTLTVTSYSAHVYARDYAAALDVVKANKPAILTWDQRSSWRIRTKPGSEIARGACDAVLGPDGGYSRGVDQTHLCGEPATSGFGGADGSTDRVIWVRCEAHALDKKEQYGKPHPRMPLPRKPVLVAEALTPGEEGGDKVIWTTEAPSPGALRLAIDRSGLCTSIGAAIWVGSEIERVWTAAHPVNP